MENEYIEPPVVIKIKKYIKIIKHIRLVGKNHSVIEIRDNYLDEQKRRT